MARAASVSIPDPELLGGANRQTQIIAALAIGGLALMILAIVIGFIVFGGDDENGANQAGAGATETALAIAAPQNEPTPTTDVNAAAAETPATDEAPATNDAALPTPTEPLAEPTPTEVVETLFFTGELTSLLPQPRTSGWLRCNRIRCACSVPRSRRISTAPMQPRLR